MHVYWINNNNWTKRSQFQRRDVFWNRTYIGLPVSNQVYVTIFMSLSVKFGNKKTNLAQANN